MSSEKNSVIKTNNLTKVYQQGDFEIRALDNVSVEIERGEFTAVVGPSGSGKTTLLNAIGGLDDPSSGSVFINGEDITQLSGNKLIDFRMRNIGFVFQAYNLIPVLTAKENVGFVMLLQGKKEDERNARVEELLTSVGLGEMMSKRPNQMSGGQQQRVAVARALAPKPEFILADEPTANLDSKSTENLLDIMARLNKEEGITFIFSTHDQRVIDRAKRVITMVDGNIVSDETRN